MPAKNQIVLTDISESDLRLIETAAKTTGLTTEAFIVAAARRAVLAALPDCHEFEINADAFESFERSLQQKTSNPSLDTLRARPVRWSHKS